MAKAKESSSAWVVSDSSLIDGIEAGIVKFPRVPVDEDSFGSELLACRDTWHSINAAASLLRTPATTKTVTEANASKFRFDSRGKTRKVLDACTGGQRRLTLK